MALEYTRFIRFPGLFRAMTGLDVGQFDSLLREARVCFSVAERRRLTRPDRKREVGGGHPFGLHPADQILLTVVWLHLRPTHEALGSLFGVSDTTVGRYLRRVYPVLEEIGSDVSKIPDPGPRQRLTLEDMFNNLPELRLLLDVKRARQ
jgi:hypothetical protein